MTSDASKKGLYIYFASGFRSYDYQAQIYNNYVARDGQALADTYSARPGYSEHQSGLAIDVNTIDDSFSLTDEAKWLANHCHEYGFILRYPEGKEAFYGTPCRHPAHFRYVGEEAAKYITEHDLCLEEFLYLEDPHSLFVPGLTSYASF